MKTNEVTDKDTVRLSRTKVLLSALSSVNGVRWCRRWQVPPTITLKCLLVAGLIFCCSASFSHAQPARSWSLYVDEDGNLAVLSATGQKRVLASSDPLPAPISSFDLNGDGLNEVWQTFYGANQLVPSGDADGDGMTNAQEAEAWTHPFVASSHAKTTAVYNQPNADWTVSWDSQGGMVYRLEWLAPEGWQLVQGNIAGTGEVISVRIGDMFVNQASNPTFRVRASGQDQDNDGVDDVTEVMLGWSPTDPASARAGSNGGDGQALLQLLRGASGTALAADISDYNAARFLAQAAWGVTDADLQSVKTLGYAGWINQQIARPVSLLMPYIDELEARRPADELAQEQSTSYANTVPFSNANGFSHVHSNMLGTAWMRHVVHANDPLRQRMAWALNQILVVSRRGFSGETTNAQGLASFQDMLRTNALGNYRDILRQTTYHPAMGWYLSHLGNQKADESINRFPDENYAREIMQLFSIGLWELNQDGTQMLDSNGRPIPSYDNDTIKELARVMTGFWFQGNTFGSNSGAGSPSYGKYRLPMVLQEAYHDQAAKQISGGTRLNLSLPANNGAMNDVNAAVDALFYHPNTAPFISRRLIQFLVKSDPSPEYVGRVAAKFANNGSGLRGDLSAVVKAILLDQEARNPLPWMKKGEGKLSEPMVKLTRVIKAFGAGATSPELQFWNSNYFGAFGQQPFLQNTVFNFFEPDFSKPGLLSQNDLLSPEFQILDSSSSIAGANMWTSLLADTTHTYHPRTVGGTPSFANNYTTPLTLVNQPRELFDWMSLRLCHRIPTARERSIILQQIGRLSSPSEKVRVMAWLLINTRSGANQY